LPPRLHVRERVPFHKRRNLQGIDSIIRGGIEPERLKLLGKLLTHEHQWSGWEKEAYRTLPLADLEDVVKDPRAAIVQYRDLMHRLDPAKAARADECFNLGLRDRGLIESTQHSPEVYLDLRRALPDSKRGVWHVVHLADKGITGTHLNTYGTKACEQYTGKELDESGVDPKVMRAFLASGVRVDFAGMKTLHGAGYMNGADLKAASRAMGTSDPAVLADARRFATGDQLATFRFYTRDQITSTDARAIGRLAKLGVEDYSRLLDNARAQYTLANVMVDRRKNVLDVHADIIGAGITPERLGRMSRAGIPVDKAADHATDTDLWAAGAPYRDAVMRQGTPAGRREIRSTGGRSPKTYQTGPRGRHRPARPANTCPGHHAEHQPPPGRAGRGPGWPATPAPSRRPLPAGGHLRTRRHVGS
jgi:hypothetical protein